MSSSESPGNHDEIDSIVQELRLLRQDRRVKEADRLKRVLLQRHSVQVFYRRDGTVGWSVVDEEAKPTKESVAWSMVDVGRGEHRADESPPSCEDVPLVIATVDAPHYRSRLSETVDFLSRTSFEDGTRFAPVDAVDLLNLSDHPSSGANRILYEGWRQILLAALSRQELAHEDQSIVFVAEDDLRLCDVSPGRMRDACAAAFEADLDLHVLSLGHAYHPAKPSRRQRRRAKRDNGNNSLSENGTDTDATQVPSSPLLKHVNSGKGLHATTLLALRHPEGTKSLLEAMEAVPFGKRCHLDQFLYHSKLHNVGIALSDPPLVGWAEVSETLTSVGSGCRKNGGGRLGQLPQVTVGGDGIQWVRRRLPAELVTPPRLE
eukprot:CAMPEP_0172530386 /NCGR_PEP_ID=MMETSP1067-20121228/4134_1 /TAXON_ID=265564 ORGANISM="Thalassiosira punctigera, Strain Tpunct2005C2" /NCGR_SAMPLE_ID=MMETSP1067 /ASSEMBLY_ACC=CAM_ASM_000444 /LENGTH=375 /DNA_ID=CAMNT_0013314579 /DNA_START=145 /DNA_END=1272 /DNA_ORIENTATION=-